jgi:hypothetical protein
VLQIDTPHFNRWPRKNASVGDLKAIKMLEMGIIQQARIPISGGVVSAIATFPDACPPAIAESIRVSKNTTRTFVALLDRVE